MIICTEFGCISGTVAKENRFFDGIRVEGIAASAGKEINLFTPRDS